MFRHVLVPLDFSRRNQASVTLASRLAAASKGRLTLLHVVQRIEGIPDAELRGFYGRLEKNAEAKMSRIAKRARKVAADVKTRIVVGNRIDEILHFAAREGVDLIVLSSHRVDLARPGEGWGTISYKVGILAKCPVLLVK
jgi:nucleotide-binding universal stress UspA family protein